MARFDLATEHVYCQEKISKPKKGDKVCESVGVVCVRVFVYERVRDALDNVVFEGDIEFGPRSGGYRNDARIFLRSNEAMAGEVIRALAVVEHPLDDVTK